MPTMTIRRTACVYKELSPASCAPTAGALYADRVVAARHSVGGHERVLRLHRTARPSRIARASDRHHQRRHRHLHHHQFLRGARLRRQDRHAREGGAAPMPGVFADPGAAGSVCRRVHRHHGGADADLAGRGGVLRRRGVSGRDPLPATAGQSGTDRATDQTGGVGGVRRGVLGGRVRRQDHREIRGETAQARWADRDPAVGSGAAAARRAGHPIVRYRPRHRRLSGRTRRVHLRRHGQPAGQRTGQTLRQYRSAHLVDGARPRSGAGRDAHRAAEEHRPRQGDAAADARCPPLSSPISNT